jgi:three-Cys-motif partner protein
MSSVDDRYWAEYDGLQSAKHQLLKNYLGGWFPILASWRGRVLYIDCHAGRGRHKTGDEGSPILALRLLLGHKLRDRILSSTEVHFLLFENDQEHYSELCSQIDALGELPKNIYVHPYPEDYESHLKVS